MQKPSTETPIVGQIHNCDNALVSQLCTNVTVLFNTTDILMSDILKVLLLVFPNLFYFKKALHLMLREAFHSLQEFFFKPNKDNQRLTVVIKKPKSFNLGVFIMKTSMDLFIYTPYHNLMKKSSFLNNNVCQNLTVSICFETQSELCT